MDLDCRHLGGQWVHVPLQAPGGALRSMHFPDVSVVVSGPPAAPNI